jgi:catechol 2,3-dioxygenase-like lactoylglutathione lyase family enzyme
MKRVTGIGGVFFKTEDPKALQAWYERHLGVPVGEHGYVTFPWRDLDGAEAMTVWSAFPRDTGYFGDGPQTFMINYRVDDLDAVLAALAAEGVTIDPKREDGEFGRFGWVVDPAGNRVELWEPPKKR